MKTLNSACVRRQELEEAIDDVSKRQAMFEKHPPQQAANIILIYVKSARNALGPPTLKVTAVVLSMDRLPFVQHVPEHSTHDLCH